MKLRPIVTGAFAVGIAVAFASAAQATTLQECNAKYKAAQAAGTLNGQKRDEFRKTECGITTTGSSSGHAPAKPAQAPVSGFQSTWGAPVPGAGRPN